MVFTHFIKLELDREQLRNQNADHMMTNGPRLFDLTNFISQPRIVLLENNTTILYGDDAMETKDSKGQDNTRSLIE